MNEIAAKLGEVGLPAPVKELAAKRWDVVVVGGGHNGLTAAAYLARAGAVRARARTPRAARRRLHARAPVPRPALQRQPVRLRRRPARRARHRGARPAAARLRVLRRRPEPVGPVRGRHVVRPVARRRQDPAQPRGTRRLQVRHRGLLGLRAPLRRDPPPAAHRAAATRGSARARPARRSRTSCTASRRCWTSSSRRRSPTSSTTTCHDQRLKDALFGQGVIAAYGGPKDPGTASIKLMHYQGDLEGQGPVWGYVKGGMGMISFAIADAAREAGAQLATGVPVSRDHPRRGRAARGRHADRGRHDPLQRRPEGRAGPAHRRPRRLRAAHRPTGRSAARS